MKPTTALKRFRAADAQWRSTVGHFFTSLCKDLEVLRVLKALYCDGVSVQKLANRLSWTQAYCLERLRMVKTEEALITVTPYGLSIHCGIDLPVALVGNREGALAWWKKELDEFKIADSQRMLRSFRVLEQRFKRPKGYDAKAVELERDPKLEAHGEAVLSARRTRLRETEVSPEVQS